MSARAALFYHDVSTAEDDMEECVSGHFTTEDEDDPSPHPRVTLLPPVARPTKVPMFIWVNEF